MKFEVDSEADLLDWLANPRPAVFQNQNLIAHRQAMEGKPLDGCSFLGGSMDDAFLERALKTNCLVLRTPPGLPFNPFHHRLYTPDELYDHLDPDDPASYANCFDNIVYRSYLQTDIDVDLMLMRRLHDASIEEALGDFLSLPTTDPTRPTMRHRTVAVMGGHDAPRGEAVYVKIAELARELAAAGYLIATGGGPGLMEAANLGAYCAGFSDGQKKLSATIAAMKDAPLYNHPRWLTSGYAAWKQMGTPDRPELSESLGVPTWFYGFEPPNVFATKIAKYFENSVREEGLLGIALAGIIFAEGNAGTVQEIFQDACQNYYRTYAKAKSPMIILGSDYWNPQEPVPQHPGDRRKPLYPLLEKLASEKRFSDYLMLTDDLTQILDFIHQRPPVA